MKDVPGLLPRYLPLMIPAPPKIRAPAVSVLRHRHLLKVLVMREVRGRFSGLMAGSAWALLGPLAMMAVYLFVFSLVLRVPVSAEETGTDSFAVYFLCGLIPWLLFSEAVSRTVGCLLANSELIVKMVFPVELLPTSSVAAACLINGTGMGLLLGYLALQGYAHPAWAVLALLLPLQGVFAWGIATFLATLNVFVRDVGELISLILMVWFFATPIIYPVSLVPAALQGWLFLNPMAHFVDLYRDALILHRVEPAGFLLVAAISLAAYILGAWFFMRARRAFGDVL